MESTRVVVLAVALAAIPLGCRRGHDAVTHGTTAAARGDPTRGRALVAQFECTRCHSVERMIDPPKDKQCTGCHHDIDAGNVRAGAAQMARWRAKVAELGDVPTLVSTGARFTR